MLEKRHLLVMALCLLGYKPTIAQNSESFFIPPGLEITLPRTEWELKNQTYEDAMWNPGQYHLRNESKNISIKFSCDLLENLEIAPDSMMSLTEDRIKSHGLGFTKEAFKGFTIYLIEQAVGIDKFEYVASATHPWGYFVSLSIAVPNMEHSAADGEARNILSHFFLLTPREVDQKLGLPYPASMDRDSFMLARKQEIREKAAGKYPEDYLEAELAKLKPEDLLWDAMDGYCWDKRYRIRAQIGAGGFSLNEALNHHYLEMDSPDITFFKTEFRKDGALLYKGLNLVMQRSCQPPIDTLKFNTFFGNDIPFYDNGKTFYWSTALGKDSLACLLICCTRLSNVWSMTHHRIDFLKKASSLFVLDHLPEYDMDPHNYDGNPRFPKQHKLNTIQISHEQNANQCSDEWVFNAMAPSSNYIQIPQLCNNAGQYDVTYLIQDLHDLNDRGDLIKPKKAPNVRDSIAFTAFYSSALWEQTTVNFINTNKSLRTLICTHSYLCDVLNGKNLGFDDPFSDEDSTSKVDLVRTAACVIQTFTTPPARRQYVSELQFSDLDSNGKEEMVRMKISSGTMTDYFVYEEEPSGVSQLPKSAEWEQRISQTEFYTVLIRMSLMKDNLLSRFEPESH